MKTEYVIYGKDDGTVSLTLEFPSLEAALEFMNPKIKPELQVGDEVKIVGDENGNHTRWDKTEGFDNCWSAPEMDKCIGTIGIVKAITPYGITLSNVSRLNWRFPPQALKKI